MTAGKGAFSCCPVLLPWHAGFKQVGCCSPCLKLYVYLHHVLFHSSVKSSCLQSNLDRRSLFRRVWLRFAEEGSDLPLSTALALAKLLTSTRDEHALVEQIFVDWQDRSRARDGAPHAGMPLPAFVQCMAKSTAGLPDDMLYLACTEQLKVPALTFEAEAELKALFDFVVAANGGSRLFTVPYLSALAEELGFAASEERARYFLTDTQAVRGKQVALRPSDWVIADESPYDKIVAKRAASMPTLPPGSQVAAPDSAVLLVRSHVAVPITSDEWVNFMSDVMRSCTTEEVKSACEVFIYLQSARPT